MTQTLLTLLHTAVVLTTAASVLGAIITDLDAFIAARKTTPGIPFDKSLAFARWVRAALVGLTAGLGVSGASAALS